jgi:hypothetical protein
MNKEKFSKGLALLISVIDQAVITGLDSGGAVCAGRYSFKVSIQVNGDGIQAILRIMTPDGHGLAKSWGCESLEESNELALWYEGKKSIARNNEGDMRDACAEEIRAMFA